MDVEEEWDPIPDAHTVVNPRAVMVKVIYALVTLSAVLRSDWTDSLTCVTHVVHWIVQVVVITPRRWISNHLLCLIESFSIGFDEARITELQIYKENPQENVTYPEGIMKSWHSFICQWISLPIIHGISP
jgi:hypothetical protein